MTTDKKIINWFISGNTGLSSTCIVEVYINQTKNPNNKSHPRDSSDFNRCLELTKAVPEIKQCFELLSCVSPSWRIIVENWTLLEETLSNEMKENPRSAPKTYSLMKALFSSIC